jgi:putative DNA primase/helicase
MRKISDERVGRQSHSTLVVNGATPAIRAALAVAADYPVFPCDPISKRPLTEHGFKEATQDPAVVTSWWRRTPEALIGVPTGSPSGLVAVDVDPEGKRWFQDHRGRLGHYRLHGTRRGKHLLYRMNGTTIRNSASEVAEGIDVRGEGGYVIWWPAHGGVAIGEPGELPKWLVRTIGKRKVTKLNRHAPGEAAEDWDIERGRLIEILPKLDPDCSHDEWREVLSAISHASGGARDGENLAVGYSRGDYWSHPATKFPGELDVRKKYRSFKNEKETNTTIATLFKRVKDAGGTIPAGRPEKNGKDGSGKVILSRADTVPEVRVDWLWKGFLARNKLHLLSGAGGAMKSTLTLALAATVSTGGEWPDGTRCPQGNVIIWTGEDDLSDTAKPRLRFAGADLKRCYFVNGVREKGKQRAFDPAFDMAGLTQACTQLGEVSLIIIDPAISVVQRDSNSAAEVRRGLDPLIALGIKQHAAIIGIHHLNKSSKGRTPSDRVTGSGAWTQAPRLSLMVAAIDAGDGTVPNRWVLTCDKTFGKGKGGGYEYTFEEEPKTEIARTVWGRRLEGSAHSILAEAEGTEEGGSKLGEAKAFLRKLLASGSMSNWDVAKRSEDAGIRGITLKRAREELGIKPYRVGKNTFRWELPNE